MKASLFGPLPEKVYKSAFWKMSRRQSRGDTAINSSYWDKNTKPHSQGWSNHDVDATAHVKWSNRQEMHLHSESAPLQPMEDTESLPHSLISLSLHLKALSEEGEAPSQKTP